MMTIKIVLKFLWILIGKPVKELLIYLAFIGCFGVFIQSVGAWVYFVTMWKLPNFMQSLRAGALLTIGLAWGIGLTMGLIFFRKSCKRAWRKSKRKT